MSLKYIVSSCAILAFLGMAVLPPASAAPGAQVGAGGKYWPNAGESWEAFTKRMKQQHGASWYPFD